jgi:hypothetical protein
MMAALWSVNERELVFRQRLTAIPVGERAPKERRFVEEDEISISFSEPENESSRSKR